MTIVETPKKNLHISAGYFALHCLRHFHSIPSFLPLPPPTNICQVDGRGVAELEVEVARLWQRGKHMYCTKSSSVLAEEHVNSFAAVGPDITELLAQAMCHSM